MTGKKSLHFSIEPGILKTWEQILLRVRKLMLLISHRLAVFAPAARVFVVGAVLRFSQLWSSQRGMLSSET